MSSYFRRPPGPSNSGTASAAGPAGTAGAPGSAARTPYAASSTSSLALAAAQASPPPSQAGPHEHHWVPPVVDWADVVKRAKARGERDCPICIGPLSRRGNQGEHHTQVTNVGLHGKLEVLQKDLART